MSAAGVRTASEKSRQLSTSSPASSRASGGARVLTRWRGVRRFSLPQGTCIYKEVCGTTQLRKCPWQFTSEGHVASMQHTQSCPTFPRSPGMSDGCSGFSDLENKDESFKTDLMFVSVSSVDKDAEKTFDSFNRMHMIWTDRV